jgi:hypothetical protein
LLVTIVSAMGEEQASFDYITSQLWLLTWTIKAVSVKEAPKGA